MTIAEYLQNPYGKGSAFSSSSKQKDDLDKQFKQISEKIISKIYRYRDFVIYHVIVPSTKKDFVNYDVVIEVETKKLHEGAANLEGLEFKVFSNCPSFIFTYAHVFRGSGMLCDWLIPKYNKEVRTKAPVKRTQQQIMDRVKEKIPAHKDPSAFSPKTIATNPHANKDRTTRTTVFTKSVKNIKNGKTTKSTKTSKTTKKI